MTAELEKAYGKYEGTKKQILFLFLSGVLTLTDIHARLTGSGGEKISKPAISDHLWDLKEAGFIKQAEKRGKGRQKYYILTDEGMEIVRGESIEREIEEHRKSLASYRDSHCMEIFRELVKAPRGLKADELFALFKDRGFHESFIREKLGILEKDKLVSNPDPVLGFVLSTYVRGVAITALLDLESKLKEFKLVSPPGDFAATELGIVLMQDIIKNELGDRNSAAFRIGTIEVCERLAKHSLDGTLREKLVQEFSKNGNVELKKREFWIKSCNNFSYSFKDCLEDSKKLEEVRKSADELRLMELFAQTNRVFYTMTKKHPEVEELMLIMALKFSNFQRGWLEKWANEKHLLS